MTPSLALLLCCLFVGGVLVIERKSNPEPSAILWIPLLWMLVTASKPLGTWFGTADGVAGSVLDQYFGLTLLLVGVVVLLHRRFSWSAAFGTNFWLLLLLVYMAASVFWSDIPEAAFKRWGREVIAVVMACTVASEHNPRRAMEAIFRRLTYILIPVSLLLIKYFPDFGVQYRWGGGQMWIGATLQKNGLGRLCLIATFFLVWSLVSHWHRRAEPAVRRQLGADILVLTLAAFLLFGPGDQYSATALASIGVGFTAYVLLLSMRRRGAMLGPFLAVTAVALIIAVGAWQPFNDGASISGVASELGRDTTLTGRTEIWFGLSSVALDKALLGSGVSSFWTERTELDHNIGEAHNGYLDIVLCLGFPGLLLTVLFVLSCCIRAQREMTRDFEWGCLWYCFLLMAAVHNITESSLNSFTVHLTATLLFLSMCFLHKDELHARSPAAIDEPMDAQAQSGRGVTS
jgi:exopolysaccharide production protein ExoQ